METNQNHTQAPHDAGGIEKRYTCEELQQLGGVSHTFIYRHVRAGTLAKPEKWGRSSRWKESDVKAWLATFQQEQGAA